MKKNEVFVIIDGHHLLFRMFYGMPPRIRTKDGILINAVIGFVGAIIKYIKSYKPQYFLVVFDSKRPNFRSEFEDDYKGNRKLDFSNVSNDENPFIQLDIIKKILDNLSIQYCEIEGFETDDVIASYTNKYDEIQKYIISGDSDLLQLVNQQTIVFMDRGKKSIIYDESMVIDKFQVNPSKIIDYKALIGDKTDNIKGLSGIGSKTAVKLLEQFGCIENIVRLSYNIMPKSLRYKIESGSEILYRNKNLIKLHTDAPLKFTLDELTIEPYDYFERKTMDILRENKYL